MQCNRILPQLNALADGELNRFQSWRVQRHLRRCPACTEELARIQEIGAEARQWRATSAPSAKLAVRIAQALATLPVGEAALPHSTKEISTMKISNSQALPMQPNTGHSSNQAPSLTASPALRLLRRSWRPVAALSLVGIALGCLAVSLRPIHKPLAFSAVRQAMQQVKTIHWTAQTDAFTQPGAGPDSQAAGVKMESWARLDKPAYALLSTDQYGSMRTLRTVEGTKIIRNGQVKAGTPLPAIEGISEDPEKRLRHYILTEVLSFQKDTAAPGKEQEDTVLNGKPAVRFYREAQEGTWKFTLSLWVDPDTHLVMRREATMSTAVAGQPDIHIIDDQFRYNEQPPAGVFNVP